MWNTTTEDGYASFDLQGGSGNTPWIRVYDGWSFGSGDLGGNEFPADPTLDGYTFGGWFTATGGGGTQIYASTIYYFADWSYYVTLYAFWY